MLNNIFLAVPNLGWIHTDLMQTILVWLKSGVTFYAPKGLQPVGYARNNCVEAFLKSEATHLLFVDADTIPHPEALLLLLKADKPIISGIVPAMKRDTDGSMKPVGMVARKLLNEKYLPVQGKGIELIDVCGMACVLIKREVFDKIPCPWFESADWGNNRGEDFSFCNKLSDNNIELWAHFNVQCQHVKEITL